MHPSIREAVARAHDAAGAHCLSTALEELLAVGAVARFARPTRAGWRVECVIEGIGQPSIGTSDVAILAVEEALRKLVKRTHAPAEAA